MPSANGPDGPDDLVFHRAPEILRASIECQLFESLVHHLIEKGVMTRNDALSVVQTVAEIKRGALEEATPEAALADRGMAILNRLYASFELLDGQSTWAGLRADNVRELRPPLHDDRPEFPKDN